MDWKQLERHPLSAEYRDITGPAWFRFCLKLKKHGILGGRKITLHEGKILDGWQMQRGCIEAGIEPDYEVLQEGVDPQDFVEAVNDERRHETEIEKAERLIKRNQRIAKAREKGDSTRKIADAEGVSQTTVVEVLKSSGEQGCSPAPTDGKVTGKDGKKQTAKKANTVLCEFCQKRKDKGVALIENCDACAQLRKKKRAAAKKKRDQQEKKSDGLPKDVSNALADTWHAECARLLSKMRTECKSAFSWSIWLDAAVLEHLKAAEECFTTAIPRKACPECKGQKKIDGTPCLNCRQGGYMASQA